MSAKPRPPVGWGELNNSLNKLVKEGTIHSYSATSGNGGALSVEVLIENGADQADIVHRVREVLPSAFAAAQVRTRSA